ncbi:MAG: flagellar basal body-associated FliL family protein [Gemmatimonadaceae bacterium]
MAEEKSVEADEAPVTAPKKGIGRLLPLIGGIGGGLVLGGVLGFTLLGPKLSHRAPAAAAHDAKATSAEAAKKADAAPPMYQIDNLVMNPAGSGGSHFLLMSVALQVKDAAAIEVLKGRDAELRDTILRLFSRKNIDQLSDINSRDQFAGELTTVLGTVFGNGIVTKIYFPQFVIQ